jgi:5-methylcytosine-specific restriction endonuclease McrBC regulatory subunit McrC
MEQLQFLAYSWEIKLTNASKMMVDYETTNPSSCSLNIFSRKFKMKKNRVWEKMAFWSVLWKSGC